MITDTLGPPLQVRDHRTASLARHPADRWVRADPLPMSRGTRSALRALIRALVPPEPGLSGDDGAERIETGLRRLLRYMNPLTRLAFRVAIWMLDWAPIWRFRSWRRFRSLPVERGSSLLHEINGSRLGPLRDLTLIVRAAVLSIYFDQDHVHRALGYRPVPFMRGRIALRSRLRAGEAPLPSDLLSAPTDPPAAPA